MIIKDVLKDFFQISYIPLGSSQHKNTHEYDLYEYDCACLFVGLLCITVECFLGLLQYLIAVIRVFPEAILGFHVTS